MDPIAAAVKAYLIPGSMPFLILGMAAGLLLLARERTARWGHRWLVALCLTYWALSMPLVATLLSRGLAYSAPPIDSAGAAPTARAIVVLTGGIGTYRHGGQEIRALFSSTAMRALEARRLYDVLPDPLVIVSGGDPAGSGVPEAEAVSAELVRLGVPPARIIVEPEARNTREHARYLPPLLARHGIDLFVLVTSPTEMRRQLRTLEAAGLKPIPSPTPETTFVDDWSVLPSSSALGQSRVAMVGYLGWVYYWWNGWL